MVQAKGASPSMNFPRASLLMAIAVAALGVLGLAGWFFHLPLLASVLQPFVVVKANTALCLILAGIALALLGQRPENPGARLAGRLCAGFVTLLGALTLLEFLLGWDLRIDEFLVADPLYDRVNLPGRMAMVTAVAFVLSGTALLSLESRTRRGGWPAQWLVLACGLLAFLSFAGYLFDVRSLYTLAPYFSIALITVIGFLLLSLGILFARPRRGIVGLLTAAGQTGALARRFLPALIFIPVASGWIALQGQAKGLYTTEFAVALLVVANVSLLTALFWANMGSLSRSEIGRVAAEQQAREREIQLESVLDNTPVVVAVTDLSGRYLMVNRHFSTVFGLPREKILGKTYFDIFPKDAADRLKTNDYRAVQEGGIQIEEAIVVKGEPRTYISGKFPIRNEQDVSYAVCGISTDVTHFKKVEDQLRQAQKMESIGRLTGGIAHDFNNVLTVINSYAALLATRLPPGGRESKQAAEIARAGDRAADLTRQLLAFSRKQVLQPRAVDLNAAVSAVGKMLERMIGEDVDLRLSLAPALGTVRVDPAQIEQVLMNLAVNARDAMPEGGALTIETTNVALGEGYAREPAGVAPGNYVMLAVSDTGTGMDKETQARIFEPFFTTKEIGKGTGLGLSTVYGIVQQSGGHIWVYSEVGRGAIFKMYFPRLDDATAEAASSAKAPEIPRGNQLVLVVEDEPMLRRLMQSALEEYGYRVLLAEGPLEALSLLRGNEGKVDILITDVVMPKMDGRELAEEVQKLSPGMPVLYVSGYADNVVAHHGVLDKGVAFLQKPFTPESLARKVGEVLARRGGEDN